MSPQPNIRQVATEMLIRVETTGAFPALLVESHLKRYPVRDARDRGFLKELLFGTLRHRRRLDHALDQISTTPVAKMDGPTRNLLRMGAYQLLYMDRVPPSAAVNETVNVGKSLNPRSSGVLNAILRRLAREPERIRWPGPEMLWRARVGVDTSHPDALVALAETTWGAERGGRWLEFNNGQAPLTLRVNTLKTDRATLLAALEKQGFAALPTRVSPDGIWIKEMGEKPLDFQSELYYVQDEAAQMVGRLALPAPGMRVLEIGAAPGGKSGHLAALMQNRGELTVVDTHKARMDLLRAALQRLGAQPPRVFVRDFAQGSEFLERRQFDRILLDAPCSGLGTLRRHPEKKWSFQSEAIPSLSALQGRLLDRALDHLAPGGRLVYATCTVFPEENERVVQRVLEKRVEFTQLPFESDPTIADWIDANGALNTTQPVLEGASAETPLPDGFFAVRIERRAGGAGS